MVVKFAATSMTTLIYATMIMLFLLDVHPLKLRSGKKMLLGLGIPMVMAVNVLLVTRLDVISYGELYPIFAQLPIFLIFLAVSGHGFIKTIFALLTTMFLTYPYRISAMILMELYNIFLLYCRFVNDMLHQRRKDYKGQKRETATSKDA